MLREYRYKGKWWDIYKMELVPSEWLKPVTNSMTIKKEQEYSWDKTGHCCLEIPHEFRQTISIIHSHVHLYINTYKTHTYTVKMNSVKETHTEDTAFQWEM